MSGGKNSNSGSRCSRHFPPAATECGGKYWCTGGGPSSLCEEWPQDFDLVEWFPCPQLQSFTSPAWWGRTEKLSGGKKPSDLWGVGFGVLPSSSSETSTKLQNFSPILRLWARWSKDLDRWASKVKQFLSLKDLVICKHFYLKCTKVEGSCKVFIRNSCYFVLQLHPHLPDLLKPCRFVIFVTN